MSIEHRIKLLREKRSCNKLANGNFEKAAFFLNKYLTELNMIYADIQHEDYNRRFELAPLIRSEECYLRAVAAVYDIEIPPEIIYYKHFGTQFLNHYQPK